MLQNQKIFKIIQNPVAKKKIKSNLPRLDFNIKLVLVTVQKTFI